MRLERKSSPIKRPSNNFLREIKKPQKRSEIFCQKIMRGKKKIIQLEHELEKAEQLEKEIMTYKETTQQFSEEKRKMSEEFRKILSENNEREKNII